MRINPGSVMIPKAYSNNNVESSRASKNIGSSEGISKTGKKDSVTLSSTTRDMQKISVSMESNQDNRADKISALKNSIANGEYQVEPDKIAEKILSSFMG